MTSGLRYAAVCLAGIVIVGLVAGGEGSSPRPERWEYAVYEVREGLDAEQNPAWTKYYWYGRESTDPIFAEDRKFRLFIKLGAQETLADFHDLVLWNHLGSQGWEYVEQFKEAIGPRTTRTQTVFRRRL